VSEPSQPSGECRALYFVLVVHTKSIQLYENTTTIANGTWSGYQDNWHNVTITPSVTLLKDHEYRHVIVTGSYPQIIHEPSWNATGGAA